MKTLTAIILFFVATNALAQNTAFIARADKAYASRDYVTAAYYYTKSLQNGTTTSQGTVPYFSVRQSKRQRPAQIAYLTYRLAEAYRISLNYTLAESNYAQVVEKYESTYPLARLWYAVCLRANNHIDEAVNHLQVFINAKNNKAYIDIAKKELSNCMFAKEQTKKQILTKAIKMAPNLNNDAGDFSLSVTDGKFWFTSSRSGINNNKHLNKVYTMLKDSMAQATEINLEFNLRAGLHYGTPSLEASGKRMYLTIWSDDNNSNITGIYLSKYANHRWTVPEKLNSFVNSVGYNSMQPFVTGDGKRLYYTSNRPGSLGGTDIWVSDLDIEGMPVNTMNLGNTINTTDDEQAPFYNEKTRKVIYSSKGFAGMGDFDLFESISIGTGWSAPRNLGFPYNSTKADLYYHPDDQDENTAYISSDRQSDCCLNLYKVIYTPPARSILLAGIVIDCATSKPLTGVKVNLADSLSKATLTTITTDTTGKYSFTFPAKRAYILKLEKEGYFIKIIAIPPINTIKKDTLYSPVACQQEFEVNKPIIISNILYDFNKAILKPQAKAVLNDLVNILEDNPDIKIELSSHTDSFGPDWSNNRLSQNRAQACVDYIVSKGISRSRIIAKGYGETMPIQPNSFPDGKDNPAGRKLNRRAEFKVLSLK
jgi:OOP family OmpA-OmpF porin